MKNILTLLFVLFGGYSLHAQDTCYGLLRNDTLTIGNNLVERTFLWNGGNIITYRLTDKSNGKSWKNHCHLQKAYKIGRASCRERVYVLV